MKNLLIILFSLISISLYSQLYIDNVNFVVSNATEITISDMDFKNNGTFTAGSYTVNFTGTSNQSIQGTSTTTFNNIKINNTSELNADVDFNVNGNLEFVSGNLDLQNSTVSLGTTGTIVNETETNRVKVGTPVSNTGIITIDRNIASGTYTYASLGNLGIELVSDKNLGNITIIRGHQIQVGMDSNKSIERYYEIDGMDSITPTNYIKMKYFDAELNGLTEADLIFFQDVSYAGGHWWTPCFTTIASNIAEFNIPSYDNWYYTHPITFEDRFTLASKNDPLPIELLSFDYSCENSTLNWTTSSETNNDYFTIEKSHDTKEWEIIDKIFGQGNSNIEHNYRSFIPENGLYYRLCQHDLNTNVVPR